MISKYIARLSYSSQNAKVYNHRHAQHRSMEAAMPIAGATTTTSMETKQDDIIPTNSRVIPQQADNTTEGNNPAEKIDHYQRGLLDFSDKVIS
jgi:hypothetical protein